MIKSFTIIQKIWLSFFCLLFGIFALLIISLTHGFSNEFQFLTIQNNYIPMKQFCRKAETAFLDQLVSYSQANTTKKTSYLETADRKAIEAEKALLNIQKLNIDNTINTYIQKMIRHYEIFSVNAHHKFTQSVSQLKLPEDKNSDNKKIGLFSVNFQKNKQIVSNNFKTLYDYLDKQINEDIQKTLGQTQYYKILCLMFSVLFVFLGFYFLKRTLKNSFLFPLFDIQNFLKKSIDGKQSIETTMPVVKSDELGQTMQYINAYIEKISNCIKTAHEDEVNLKTSLKTFQTQSQKMVSEIEQINNTSNEVMNKASQLTHFVNEMTKASEQVSMNIIGISSTTEQVAGNMSETKESIEKMTASVNYIARSTEEGMNISENIMEMAANANSTINSLGEAAREIGKVTGVIKRIAVQTNLLALNASIEASTAGEAGKGFAVVANKIKQFASQSAKSAEDIASRIEGVESKTENAIEVINNISDTIDMVSLTIGFIADAVDQQNRSAGKINQYVQSSDEGANHIAQTISEATEIVENISKFTLKSTRGAQEVSMLIQELNDQTHTSKRFTRQLDIRIQEMVQFVDKIYRNVHL
ncbi:methyl-accepting chemotaxis protein [Candidatus Magnetomorum sp. HK-1]|nr:methyl-accepting chemotaxis protein [Candidatus Magnetomorum sp. HK-1]